MAEFKIIEIKSSRTRARAKKKANRGRIVLDSSNSIVAKTDAAASTTVKEKKDEPILQVLEGGPLAVQAEILMEVAVEPSEERTETASLNLPPQEQTRSVESEEVLQPKTSGELVKELMLREEILEQAVAHVGGMVVDTTDIPLPPSLEEEIRPEVEKKTSEEPKKLDVTFPYFLQDSVASLLKYLDKKREKYDVRKELGFYVELVRNRTQLKRAVAVKRSKETIFGRRRWSAKSFD
ncbi:hypothetical protein AXG93_2795s1010 [Marchantia polymorpha subsp. ruderalis]|uniref:Uncharacterized protein n=1 Tax=Marchantia polymorpha subsp. ruderalis TaxID=1480154 RepID=A0A176VEK0_MARPO|nr:hypothetical protein AXG93_2795s1010 [Marchantia polymorpha subsp. ruderalis]